ncbi:PaaI family thioesterase [Mycobacterium sp. NAZ190054]|uniref:PaaI family thioesterase n=1 Tax=Mycobacterium sp. NAZ190054 TaxID=1747766 RepID=UPI00079A897C|nr:PaaI family thioesterase [Mycobacterium sp. NAZ190054]KWX65799.1 phenylacetic acid degradation protein [Mycobacterium sp. NAZ190054]
MQVTPGHLFAQMNFRDVEDSDERMVIELDNRPDLVNRRGALQGGLVATLIDIAAGRLADRHVGPGQDVTTADMTIHYLSPVLDGPARAEATVVRAGRRLSVIAVDVTDVSRGRLAARATVSFAVLDPARTLLINPAWRAGFVGASSR